MSLHQDLLDQAKMLLSYESGKPKQATLRRAVSTAYYSLFHLLVSEASSQFAKGESLRKLLSRTFIHGEMKSASKSFAGGNLPARFEDCHDKSELTPEIRTVAKAFVDLQQARHEADYDLNTSWTRVEVKDIVERAEEAFKSWDVLRKQNIAALYCTSLLLWDRWKK